MSCNRRAVAEVRQTNRSLVSKALIVARAGGGVEGMVLYLHVRPVHNLCVEGQGTPGVSVGGSLSALLRDSHCTSIETSIVL